MFTHGVGSGEDRFADEEKALALLEILQPFYMNTLLKNNGTYKTRASDHLSHVDNSLNIG